MANGVNINATCSTNTITNLLRALTIAAPATPYTIDVNLVSTVLAASQSFYEKSGVLWTDGTKAQAFSVIYSGIQTGGSPAIQVENYNTFSTFSANAAGPFGYLFNHNDLWMRMANNGTNITFSTSNDGITWVTVYTVAKASGFLGASGYTNVGFFVNEQVMGSGGIGSVTLRSWYVH